jgi:hypothetical protein
MAVMKRAETYDEIRPLIQFCKDGRVFDAQAWVAAGKPLDPPHWTPKKARKHRSFDSCRRQR